MINDENLQAYKNWFVSYVNSFLNLGNNYKENIQVKIDHTYRVIEEMKALTNSLGLSNADRNLAELIALFHDVGRFEQYAKYRTFSDRRSENHAIMGVNVLRDQKVLAELRSGEQDFIYRCIMYHNRATLPLNETPKCLKFTKLLRDADKLDVLGLIVNYYEHKQDKRNTSLELELPDNEGFNHNIYNDIMEERIVLIEDVKNLNDFKLLQLGWLFDINYKHSFKVIKERKYISRLIHQLPKTTETAEIDEKLTYFMNQKLKQTA